MKRQILIMILVIGFSGLKGQSDKFIDSLKTDKESLVIVFESNCNGCIVMNSPCLDYSNDGNPKDKYVIWKNKQGYNIKRFNICGSSRILTYKKWKNNPFDYINSKTIELDTTKLQYPLSFNRRDSTWFETGLNHYKSFIISFLSYDIKNIEIKDFAFQVPLKDESIWTDLNIEFRKNITRYDFNNNSAIKHLLDILLDFMTKNDKKLKITNANCR